MSNEEKCIHYPVCTIPSDCENCSEYMPEIIHCKDCKFYELEHKGACAKLSYGDELILYVGSYDHCRWAEREE